MQMSNIKYYAGIGSRQTPAFVCGYFTELAKLLQSRDYVLRSGAALGADSAFENGVSDPTMKEIILPWREFNGHESQILPNEQCFLLAQEIHHNWKSLTRGAKSLHARNIKQILGDSLDSPVDFVLCWTDGGKTVGGTATAIRLAELLNIPVFNFGKYGSLDAMSIAVETFLEKFI